MKNFSLILGLMAIATTGSNVNAMAPDGHTGVIENGARSVKLAQYENNRNLHTITIPASVRGIQKKAFRYSGLRSVKFENGSQLQRIDNEAFAECHDLEEITIPASVQEIRDEAFLGSGIQNLTIEQGNGSCAIRKAAFAMTELKTADIRKNVSVIEDEAFKINNIKNVKLTSVSTIGKVAFAMGRELESVSLLNCNNLTIEQDAFFKCENLTNFTISGTIRSIHPNAFGYFENGEHAPIQNFIIHGADNATIRNQLIAAGIRPEAIHFIP